MIALLKKEIRYFFTSAIGYIVIGVFLLCNSLLLWILPSQYNIFDSGFASLYPFFNISSWILVFLIPALTMRSISEEKRTGMLSLLLTKPLKIWQIVLGKYLGVGFLVFITLLCSLMYVYMISSMAYGNDLDWGVIIGSYMALLLLGFTFISVGIWASSISQNQASSFVLATFLNFFFFYGLDQFIGIISDNILIRFGFKSHFDDLSRGVIDTRNIIYFLTIIALFLYLTHQAIRNQKQ